MEEVNADFFDQGQALHQVPRQTLVNAQRDAMKVKIVRVMTFNLLWDLILGLAAFAFWIQLKNTDKIEVYDRGEWYRVTPAKKNLCQVWCSVFLPFIIWKFVMLI